jgi:hypothetical protein
MTVSLFTRDLQPSHHKPPATRHSFSLTCGQKDFRGHTAFSTCFGTCSCNLQTGLAPFVATESMILREPSLLHESIVPGSVMMALDSRGVQAHSMPVLTPQLAHAGHDAPSVRELLEAPVVAAVKRLVIEHPGPKLRPSAPLAIPVNRKVHSSSSAVGGNSNSQRAGVNSPLSVSLSLKSPTRAPYRIPFT